MYVDVKYNQSVYDFCNFNYGSLDYLTYLLIDNQSVFVDGLDTDLSTVKQLFVRDDLFVTNVYGYFTKYIPQT